jgi:acyl carrier protein
MANTFDVTGFCLKLDELVETAPGTVKPEQALEDLEAWDSVAVVSFIALADSDYGVNLPAKAIAECITVQDLAHLIAERVA